MWKIILIGMALASLLGCATESASHRCARQSHSQREYFECMDQAGHLGDLSNHNEGCGVSGLYCAPTKGY